jgi:hypothetical protein
LSFAIIAAKAVNFNTKFRQKKRKQGKRSRLPCFVCNWESHIAGTHFGKALAAIHRTVALGLKGHTSFTTAGGAGSREEFTGTTRSIFTGVTAGLAALGLVLEATLSVKFLLTGSEHEFVSTFLANQGFVFVHFESSLLKFFPVGTFYLRSAHAVFA